MNASFEQFFENSISISEDCDFESAITLLPSCKGVIFFAGHDDLPILLLTTANIRQTGKTRLAESIDAENHTTKKANLRDITAKIYYLRCFSEFMAVWQHYKIAKQIFPDSYLKLLNLGSMDYVSISLSDEWPDFTIAGTPRTKKKDSIIFGPFVNHKSANEFIKILCDSLSLCRRTDLVSNMDRAKACPYLQMSTCPAPCVGNISRQEYRKRIELAIQAGSGNLQPAIDFLKEMMSGHAQSLNFELANDVKRKIAMLEQISPAVYRWTTKLEDLRILHIAKSAKLKIADSKKRVQSYDVFLVKGTSLFEFAKVTLSSMPQLLEEIESIMHSSDEGECDPLLYNILGRFLYRSSLPGIWLDVRSALPDFDHIVDLINESYP